MKNDKKEGFLRRLLKKKVIIIVIVLVVYAVWRFGIAGKGNDVESVEIKKGVVLEELILSGEIKADEHASLSFQTSGKLSWVGVKEGEEVKKGQSLARIDATNLSQDLKIADATLRARAASLDTVYDDLEGNEDSETFAEIETRTTAETNKDSAVFTNIKAQHNLANASLVSPFAGIVSFIAHPFPGINILFSQPQIEVVNPRTMFFEVSADQSEVIDLYDGQKVNIIFDSFPDKEIEGNVAFIGYTPMSGEVGTVYKVKVSFSEGSLDPTIFRVGMTGDAKFILSESEDVLYVPPNFVNSDTKGKYLRLDSKNNKVYVDVGAEGEERVEVEGDIKEGDVVFD